MKYNDRGEELPDDTPIEIPLKFKRPPTLQEQIKSMVRGELSRAAAMQGHETFEESDDFDVGDDDALPPSNYEFIDMPIERIMEKKDASILDKRKGKEEDDGTVNGDRIKESEDVRHSGVDDLGQGAGSGGKERASFGGERGSAGSGGK